jgi:hypothetical protein
MIIQVFDIRESNMNDSLLGVIFNLNLNNTPNKHMIYQEKRGLL